MPSQEENEQVIDNKELSSHGRRFLKMFLVQYMNISFPLLTAEAKLAIQEYLSASSTLAHIAVNLGYQVCFFYFLRTQIKCSDVVSV